MRIQILMALLATSVGFGGAYAQDSSMSFFLTSKGPGDGANLGGLAGADAHCQMLAESAGAGGKKWRAYLSTNGADGETAVNARDRIGTGPWSNAKGVQVASDVADLHSEVNKLGKENSISENGDVINGRGDTPNRHDILTGSGLDGAAISDGQDHSCRDWTYGGSDGSAQVGHHDRTGGGANPTSWNSAHGSRGCSQSDLQGSGGDGLFYCFAIEGATISASIENSSRAATNRDRDEARRPAEVLAFVSLGSGDIVLDYGAGGGYWTELFSSNVGKDGKIYAHQRAGERFESQKETMTAQFAPFGNIELLPVESGASLPLEDNSVDAVMLSYIYHHLHYAEESGEDFPASSAALLSEFSRVLRPGGTFIVIEHVAIDGASRAESAGWHRTPPDTAKADITGVCFEFVADAPEIFKNPDDDLKNVWYETGLSGKTTTFVHKYRMPN
jgi:predicted methyltransferase